MQCPQNAAPDGDSWGYEYEAKQGRISKTYDEKFLGNPRDRETWFDFTGARLYSSKLGVFLGAEPLYDELQGVSPYSYGLNNPVKHKDKDGNFPIDVVLDVAFIVSDVIDIAQTMMKGETVSGAQWGALAGDVVGAVVPGLTGVGKMVKAGDAAVDAGKIKQIGPAGDAGGTIKKQLPDFIVSPEGTVMPIDQERMRKSFDDASFPKRDATQTKEKGVIHTVPTKRGNVEVRSMEGSEHHPKRSVITHPGTNSKKTIDGKTTNNADENHIYQK